MLVPSLRSRSLVARLLLIAIVLAGLGLRLFRLGEQSFWNDEVAQLRAALQPTVGETIRTVREQAMAMPLDFMVSRVVASISLDEAVLRAPAVLWTVLSIVATYVLGRHLVSRTAALFAATLLAFSSMHVYHGQEMRFYSTLFFLYPLANLLMVRGLRLGGRGTWWALAGVLIVGVYVHIYMALVPVGGFVYLALAGRDRRTENLRALGCVTLLVAVCLAPGFWYFGSTDQFAWKLLSYDKTLAHGVARGMGWMSAGYGGIEPSMGAWGWGSLAATAVGLATVLTVAARYRILLALIIGVVLQLGAIVFADWYRGYFFSPRQILHLAPIVMVLTGLGVVRVTGAVARVVARDRETRVAGVLGIAVGLLFAASAVPRLERYYGHVKSHAREVVEVLLAHDEEGGPIFVFPHMERQVYAFYLDHVYERPDVTRRLQHKTWKYVGSRGEGPAFVILPTGEMGKRAELLSARGYYPILEPPHSFDRTRTLLARK